MNDVTVADPHADHARRILIRRIMVSLAILTLFALFTTGCAWSNKAKGAVIGHQMDQQAEELEYALPGAQVQRAFAATNETDAGRRENRRVEVAIFAQQ